MNEELSFSEQTRLPQWRKLREIILMRDGCMCKKCNQGATVNPMTFYITAKDNTVKTNKISYRLYPVFYQPNIKITNSYFIESRKFSKGERANIQFSSIAVYPFLIGIDNKSNIYITLWSKISEAEDWINNGLVYLNTYRYENINVYFLSPHKAPDRISLPLIRYCTTSDAQQYPLPTPAPINIYNGQILQVHHKYYLKDKMIWEVPESALITLCRNCHQNEHKQKRIPIYNKNPKTGERAVEFYHDEIPCRKCGGSRYFREYKHVDGGICFRCGGTGIEKIIEPSNKNLLIMSEVNHTQSAQNVRVVPQPISSDNIDVFDLPF